MERHFDGRPQAGHAHGLGQVGGGGGGQGPRQGGAVGQGGEVDEGHGALGQQAGGGFDAVPGAGQADVAEQYIDAVLAEKGLCGGAGGGRAHHGVALVDEQLGQVEGEDGLVFDH